MAWFDDIDVLNNVANANSDFSITSGFDSPTDNDSSATTPIYVEGSACGWMPLKKGVTNGYNATSTISGTPTLTNRIVVGFLNYPFADLDAIPITSMYMRLSSATGFTTNYLQWDAKAQLLSPENVPISGHTPIIGYEDAGTETGTFNGNSESVGWVATTGNNADGKQGGFDWFFIISYVGAHSATLSGTYFSGLYSEYFDNEGNGLPGETSRPIGVLSQAGNFFQSNIKFQLGHGTSDTANLVVTETGKTIFFNNLHINHELGYVFVDPASTHEVRLTLTDCVHFWNDQSATAEIFKNANNATYLKVDGCSFSDGGKSVLPSYSTNRWIKTSKFNACREIDIGDCTFEDNTVSGATLGVIYIGNTDTRRAKRTSYTNNTTAIEFDTVGNYDLDGDSFSGNTYDIENSDNASTITAGSFVVGRAYKILTVGTTDFTAIGSANNTIGTKFVATGVGTGTGTATEVLLINALNGANPSGAKINNSGTNSDTLIQNAVTLEVTVKRLDTGALINGARVRLMQSSDDAVVLEGLTNASGYISASYNYPGSAVAVYGWVREATGAPFFRQSDLAGSITASGYSATVQLIRDD